MIEAEDEVKLILKHGGAAAITKEEANVLVDEIKADSSWMRMVVVVATLAIWLFLVVGTYLCLARSGITKDLFVELATKVLLPLYQTTIAAVLAYVFGKPVTKAIVRRLL